MAHAFASAAVELKQLKNKLNSSTFSAVFAASPVTRSASLSNASATEQRVQEVVQKALTEAHQVASFIQNSHGRNLLETVDGLIHLIEQSGPQMAR
jgi:hypothetical protein